MSADSALELVLSTEKSQVCVLSHRKGIFFHVTIGRLFREKFSIKTSLKTLRWDSEGWIFDVDPIFIGSPSG